MAEQSPLGNRIVDLENDVALPELLEDLLRPLERASLALDPAERGRPGRDPRERIQPRKNRRAGSSGPPVRARRSIAWLVHELGKLPAPEQARIVMGAHSPAPASKRHWQTDTRAEAIEQLLAGKRARTVASELEIPIRTIYRWRRRLEAEIANYQPERLDPPVVEPGPATSLRISGSPGFTLRSQSH